MHNDVTLVQLICEIMLETLVLCRILVFLFSVHVVRFLFAKLFPFLHRQHFEWNILRAIVLILLLRLHIVVPLPAAILPQITPDLFLVAL